MEENKTAMKKNYYTSSSGYQLKEFVRDCDFNCGNAVKYAYRAGRKAEEALNAREMAIKDLNKAMDYIYDEIVNVYGGECKYQIRK